VEVTSADHQTATGLATLFLTARVLYIFGMYRQHGNGSVRFRQAGVMGTTIAIVAMALWVIYLFVTANL